MRRATAVAVLVVAALVQVTVAPRLAVAGAFPNLVLLAAVCATWTLGARSGLAWACAGGLLLDLASPGPVGPHALAVLSAAYVACCWTRSAGPHELWHVAAAAAAGTAAYSAVLVVAGALERLPVPAAGVAVHLAAASSVYNAVLAPCALLLARRLLPAPRLDPGAA